MFGNQKLVEFRLLGFPISLDTSWLIIAGLITWSLSTRYFPYVLPYKLTLFYILLSMVAAVGFFASILLHELGHSVTARNYGIRIHGIMLYIFGGVAQMERNPSTPKEEFMVAAAGPFVSILLGFLFMGLTGLTKSLELGRSLHALFYWLMEINFVLAIFNLIPAFPLDGGRIFRSIAWKLSGNFRKATLWAATAGMGFSFLLMAYGAWEIYNHQMVSGIWSFFIASFLFQTAKATAEHYK